MRKEKNIETQKKKKRNFTCITLILLLASVLILSSGCSLKKLAEPEISAITNTDGTSQVTITNQNDVGGVYYTVDGTDPLTNSKLYEGSIVITETTTLKARVIYEDVLSDIATQQFTITQTSAEGATDNTINNAVSNTQSIQSIGQTNTVFNVNASSALSPMGDNYYYAGNLVDNNWSTAWIEGAAGNGYGEYILFTYTGSQAQIQGISIVNGYAKSDQAFYENGCVTSLDLYVNGNYSRSLSLAANPSTQYFDFNNVVSNGDTIQFVIRGVQEGPSDGEFDTAMTEIAFY
ncbi:FN3 associated domain-containing protein [Eubacteriaceae bacterium ES2]|nr:FN3 associated domain-containing protein [Eubacteriaceae bacterium ES2]